MDDFNVSALHESKNEWCARLLTILTPLVVEGFYLIFNDAYRMCIENDEPALCLKTFQNLLSRVPKWNATLIEEECTRISTKSECAYLEDLVACVHVVQLKILTAMRVGHKQKKIAIDIPKWDVFVHKTYINCARKLYKNTYLFEMGVSPLQQQKLGRELELIVQECILNTVRESIPVENILKVYMDESIEEDTVEELKEEMVDAPPRSAVSAIDDGDEAGNHVVDEAKKEERDANKTAEESELDADKDKDEDKDKDKNLSFSDVDFALTQDGHKEKIAAPKDLERLEEISVMRNEQRKMEDEDDAPLETIVLSDAAAAPDLEFEEIGSSSAPASDAIVLNDAISLGDVESI